MSKNKYAEAAKNKASEEVPNVPTEPVVDVVAEVAKAKEEAELKASEVAKANEEAVAKAREEAKVEAKAEFEAEAKVESEKKVKAQTAAEADAELKALEDADKLAEDVAKAQAEAKSAGVIKEELPTLIGTIRAIGEVLAVSPDAMTIERVHENKVYFYRWVEANSDGRRKIGKLLHAMWQLSTDKFNYDSLAKRLRVKVVDVQGILDADFIEDNNLESYK